MALCNDFSIHPTTLLCFLYLRSVVMHMCRPSSKKQIRNLVYTYSICGSVIVTLQENSSLPFKTVEKSFNQCQARHQCIIGLLQRPSIPLSVDIKK